MDSPTVVPERKPYAIPPQCEHIKDNGIRCGSPALRRQKLCYFHGRQRRDHPYRRARTLRVRDQGKLFEELRDSTEVQIAICRVMNGIVTGRLSSEEGSTLLYAIQTAITNL